MGTIHPLFPWACGPDAVVSEAFLPAMGERVKFIIEFEIGVLFFVPQIQTFQNGIYRILQEVPTE